MKGQKNNLFMMNNVQICSFSLKCHLNELITRFFYNFEPSQHNNIQAVM